MTDKIALVTGASRGLGRSTALHLAALGVTVIGTYQSQDAQAKALVEEIEKQGGRAAMLQLDVSDIASFDGFVQRLSSVLSETFGAECFDYLVNNAGTGINASLAQTSEAQFDQLMNIHLKGPFFLTQKLLPLIADHGRIVNLSTGLTRFTMPGWGAYATMKGGVETWTRYLAKELGPRGISVNAMAPGAIETDFGGGTVRDNADINRQIAANIALGRVGVADDIGGAIAGLLADGSAWINGQRIEASGGMFL